MQRNDFSRLKDKYIISLTPTHFIPPESLILWDLSLERLSLCCFSLEIRLTNCQGLSLTIKELTTLSRVKHEKYGNVKEKIAKKYNCQGIKINV